jgi:hypothetical protein
VREQDLFHGQADLADGRLNAVEISARVDHCPFLAVLVLDQVHLLERSNGDDGGFEGHVSQL